MKRILFIAAIALGSVTAMNAQDQSLRSLSQQNQTTAQLKQAEMKNAAERKAELQAVEAAGKYKKVELSSVPQSVKQQVQAKYPGATLGTAEMNEKGEYRISLLGTELDAKVIYIRN